MGVPARAESVPSAGSCSSTPLMRRVVEAGHQIMELCIAVGGALTGEHGVGLEKLDMMERLFSPQDLDAMCRVRDAWDPARRLNPGKTLPVRACRETRQGLAREVR